MSEIFEGVGTAAEGGLFARALDPQSGAKERHPGDPENCLNCGTPLTGAYCHACGQAAHIHRTIGGFMHDLLHGALHFEGKMWRTLPMLALKPGTLTRRYIEGARARFVSPMALFLFCVFLMFATFQVLGVSSSESSDDIVQTTTGSNDFLAGMRDGLNENSATLAIDPETGEVSLAGPTPPAESGEPGDTVLENGSDSMEVEPIIRADLSDMDLKTGVEWIDKGVVKKWNDNPDLMLYKLQANSYKFSWLLIPISVPFVWLLFLWRRRFKAYDHAIFVTYSLSFMTLLFVVVSVLEALHVSTTILALAILLIPPIHLYKQLRGAYELRRFSAFWRLMVLSAFIWIVVLIFIQILLVLGAF